MFNPVFNNGQFFPGERTKSWQTTLRIMIGHFGEDNEEGNLQWPPQRNTQRSPENKKHMKTDVRYPLLYEMYYYFIITILLLIY